MASLKSLVNEKLGKSPKAESKTVEAPVTAPASKGRLKEHFESKVYDVLTESELQAVMEDCLPHIDRDDPKYAEYIEEAARIKRDNPALYHKMKNWE